MSPSYYHSSSDTVHSLTPPLLPLHLSTAYFFTTFIFIYLFIFFFIFFSFFFSFFFFNDTPTTEIYTLSLHDALPIYPTSEVIEVSKETTDTIIAISGAGISIELLRTRSSDGDKSGSIGSPIIEEGASSSTGGYVTGDMVKNIIDATNTSMDIRNSQPNTFLFFLRLDALDLVSIAVSVAPSV